MTEPLSMEQVRDLREWFGVECGGHVSISVPPVLATYECGEIVKRLTESHERLRQQVADQATEIARLTTEIALTHQRLDELDEKRPLHEFVPGLVDEGYRRAERAEQEIARLTEERDAASMKAVEMVALVKTFVAGKDVPITIERSRAVLVDRLTRAEQARADCICEGEVRASVIATAEARGVQQGRAQVLALVRALPNPWDEDTRYADGETDTAVVRGYCSWCKASLDAVSSYSRWQSPQPITMHPANDCLWALAHAERLEEPNTP